MKCSLDRRERLVEAGLDRLRQVVAQLLELGEARLEVLPLHGQLLEALLLGLVLLLRKRVDLPELHEPAVVALELLGELVAVVALGRLGAGRLEPPPRLVALGVGARELDVDRRQPLAGGGRSWPQLDLLGAEPPERRAELARARSLLLGSLAHGHLEPLRVDAERRLEPLGTARGAARARARSAGARGPGRPR